MRILYLDCGMGAAGDMLTAALLELLPDREKFLDELNCLEIPGVVFSSERAVKCGICGTHITVKVNGEEESEEMYSHSHAHSHDEEKCHHQNSMNDIEHIIEGLQISKKVKSDVLQVYSLIAEAESHVHGIPVREIHFHETGTIDAVADVTAVCMLMERLSPDRVVISPIHVGSGHVKCSHGILPVPAPATAYILRDVPIYGGGIKSELCTPTGAALIKHFASSFGEMPVMKTVGIGYGMGKKDFTAANCVRALIGEEEDSGDAVAELRCNLDDMTAEAIGFAEEQLFAAGALEVYTVPIQMKKSRPGILLSVMCREEDKEKLLKLIFRHTTTLGVRESIIRRYTLSRSFETVKTDFGEVRKKVSVGYGAVREKYEYEDIAKIARNQEMSLSEVTAHIQKREKREWTK